MLRRLGTLCTITAILISAGCYGYLPVPPETPVPGTHVRADVTEQAAATLITQFGPGVLQLRGMVVEQQADRLSMTVDAYMTARNGDMSGNNVAVWVPFTQIRRIEEKRLSIGRSAILGAAFIGGAVLVTEIVANSGRQLGDEDDPPPTPTERRKHRIFLPIFRIPTSW